MSDTIYLGIGSNINPAHNIAAGLKELEGLVELRRVSSVYRSAAYGFAGDPFLNLVVEAGTAMGLPELARSIREMERRYGRPDVCAKFSPRTLDIDILTFGDLMGEHDGIVLPRAEATVRDYVLCPFAELAPTLVIPGQKSGLCTLWAEAQAASFLERLPLALDPYQKREVRV